MKLRITGRHMDVTSALRRYLETRFARLDRYELKAGIVQVVLSVEKLQHKAEAVCVVHGKRVQAKTSTREMYATIDALVDRIDGQLRKLKERVVSHKPAKATRARSVRALAAELAGLAWMVPDVLNAATGGIRAFRNSDHEEELLRMKRQFQLQELQQAAQANSGATITS